MSKVVLFFGSDPYYNWTAQQLALARVHQIEIPQERAVLEAVYSSRKYFKFSADEHATWESFTRDLEQEDPSVVHISSHGMARNGNNILVMRSGSTSAKVYVDATMLKDAFASCPRLELVVLDACHSAPIAQQLSLQQNQYFCVGYDNVLNVAASTKGTHVFHTSIAAGKSVQAATDTLVRWQASVRTSAVADVRMFKANDLEDRPIRPAARILARFFRDDPTMDSSDSVAINFGLDLQDSKRPRLGNDLYLVCFFSDNPEHMKLEYVTLINVDHIGEVIWHRQPSRDCWDYQEDETIFCTYVHLKSMYSETISCEVSQALTDYYSAERISTRVRERAKRAIKKLRARP